jgi:predicted XRE-type DNA-binding protein
MTRSTATARKRATTRAIPVQAGSGNVFQDVGFEDSEARLAKAELAGRIVLVIQSRKLTQVRAGALLGISQADVSDLVRGKLQGFSTDRLFRFLNALGQDVEIVVRARRPGRAAGRLRVLPDSAKLASASVRGRRASLGKPSANSV